MTAAAVGVAPSVEALVVPTRVRNERREPGRTREPARSDRGVLVDGSALDGGERTGPREDRLRHLELADVVHEAAPVDLADLRFGQLRELGDLRRETRDPARVRESVGAAPLELGHDERRLDLAVAVECPC